MPSLFYILKIISRLSQGQIILFYFMVLCTTNQLVCRISTKRYAMDVNKLTFIISCSAFIKFHVDDG